MAHTADDESSSSPTTFGGVSGSARDINQARSIHQGDVVTGTKLVARENGKIVQQVGGILNHNVTEFRPPPARLRPHFDPLGRPDSGFLGRRVELEQLAEKLIIGQPGESSDDQASPDAIYVYATKKDSAEGWGRSSLLRKLAFEEELSRAFPDGVVQISAAGLAYEDIRQELFERTHTWDGEAPLYHVNDSQVASALVRVRAVIILDDFELDGPDVKRLFDLARLCAFVLGVNSASDNIAQDRSVPLGGLEPQQARSLFLRSAGQTGEDLSPEDQQVVDEIVEQLARRPASLARFGRRVSGTASLPELSLAEALRLVQDNGDLWPYVELESDGSASGRNRLRVVEQLASVEAPAPFDFVEFLSSKLVQENADWLVTRGLASVETLEGGPAEQRRPGRVLRIEESVRQELRRDKRGKLERLRHSTLRDVDEWIDDSELTPELVRTVVPFLLDVLEESAKSGDSAERETANRVVGKLRPLVDMSIWPGLTGLFFDSGVNIASGLGPQELAEARAWQQQHTPVEEPRGRVGPIVAVGAALAALMALLRFGSSGRHANPLVLWLAVTGGALVVASGALVVAGVVAWRTGDDHIQVIINTPADGSPAGPATVSFDWGPDWDGDEGHVTRVVECDGKKRFEDETPVKVRDGELQSVNFAAEDLNRCQITITFDSGVADDEGEAQGLRGLLRGQDGELASAAQDNRDQYQSVLVLDDRQFRGDRVPWTGDFRRIRIDREVLHQAGRALEFALNEQTGLLTELELATVQYNCTTPGNSPLPQTGRVLVPGADLSWRTPALPASSSCTILLVAPDRGLSVSWSPIGCTKGQQSGRELELDFDDCPPDDGDDAGPGSSPADPIRVELGLDPDPMATVSIASHVSDEPDWLAPGDLAYQFECVETNGHSFLTSLIEPLDLPNEVVEELPLGASCSLSPGTSADPAGQIALGDHVIRNQPTPSMWQVNSETTEIHVDITPNSTFLRLVADGLSSAPNASGSVNCTLPNGRSIEHSPSLGVRSVWSTAVARSSVCTIELDPRSGWRQTIEGRRDKRVSLERTRTLVISSIRATPVYVKVSTAGEADNSTNIDLRVTCEHGDGTPIDDLLTSTIISIGATEIGSLPTGAICRFKPTFSNGADGWTINTQPISPSGPAHPVTILGEEELVINAVLTRNTPSTPSTSSQVIAVGALDAPAIPVTYDCGTERSGSVSVGQPLELAELRVGRTCAVTLAPITGWEIRRHLAGENSTKLVEERTTIRVGASRTLVLELRRTVAVALKVQTTSTAIDLTQHGVSIRCPMATLNDLPSDLEFSIMPVLHQDLPVGPIPAGTYCTISIEGLGNVIATVNGQTLSGEDGTQVFVPDVTRHIITIRLDETGTAARTRSLTISIVSDSPLDAVSVPWSCSGHPVSGPWFGAGGERFTEPAIELGSTCTVGPVEGRVGLSPSINGGPAVTTFVLDSDRHVVVEMKAVPDPPRSTCEPVRVFGTGMENRSRAQLDLVALGGVRVRQATLVWAGSPDSEGATSSTLMLDGNAVAGQHNGTFAFAPDRLWHQWSSDVTDLIARSAGRTVTLEGWDHSGPIDDRTGASLYVWLDEDDCPSTVLFDPEGTTVGDRIQGVLPTGAASDRTATLRWNLTPTAVQRTATLFLSVGGVDQTRCRNHALTLSVEGGSRVVIDSPFSPAAQQCVDEVTPPCQPLMLSGPVINHEWSILRCRIDLPAGATTIDIELQSSSTLTEPGMSGVLVGRGVLVIEEQAQGAQHG